jgi:hypothetical protein
MARGGYRPGSGRKPGSSKQKEDAAAQLEANQHKLSLLFNDDVNSMTPLDVLLLAMKANLAKGTEAGLEMAAKHAQAAASFIHPRLQNIVQTNADVEKPQTLTKAQILAQLADLRSKNEPEQSTE